jgi:hypothetical protein
MAAGFTLTKRALRQTRAMRAVTLIQHQACLLELARPLHGTDRSLYRTAAGLFEAVAASVLHAVFELHEIL